MLGGPSQSFPPQEFPSGACGLGKGSDGPALGHMQVLVAREAKPLPGRRGWPKARATQDGQSRPSPSTLSL